MFEFKMSSFTKIDKKILHDRFDVSASMEEEGTGKCYLKHTFSQ